MRAKSSCRIFALLMAGALGVATADPTDDQIRKAQANVDNEAVLVYGGKVGKLDAMFALEIDGGLVDGHYYYPTRDKNQRFKLKGTNPKDGVLVLQEFTEQKDGSLVHSASCRLTKRVTDSRIYWEGTMNNTDGRSFPMHFSRPK